MIYANLFIVGKRFIIVLSNWLGLENNNEIHNDSVIHNDISCVRCLVHVSYLRKYLTIFSKLDQLKVLILMIRNPTKHPLLFKYLVEIIN